MGQRFYNEADVQAIAAAIRGKNGTQNTYTVSQMAAAVTALPSGASNCKTFTVTVSADQTDKYTLTAADADIAAHRADSSSYGYYMRTNGSGSNSYGFIAKASTFGGTEIGTNASGAVYVYASSTLNLRAGTYTMFCGW